MKNITWSEISDKQKSDIIKRPASNNNDDISKIVENIVSDVRENGDSAVRKYTSKFDKCDLKNFQVSANEIIEAEKNITPENKLAIENAYKNIFKFHEYQGLKPYTTEIISGVTCSRKVMPIESVGLYVPGGTAPLVSTTLMIGIPSLIAKCKNRIVCTPCDKDGKINPHIIYAAKICGINKIFKIGGAQAIAAMAFGTETIPSVDKIFGPGNAFVTEAKKLVSQSPDGAALDMPAGPSEVCVIADKTTNPIFAAADLLSQAEHDTLSQVVLISLTEQKRAEILEQMAIQIETLPRKDIATKAIENSLAIIADDLDQAIEISNLYAPEHLILCFDDANKSTDKITHAASIFIGQYSTESAGDYCSGTNHALPTYGYAKNYSGLSVEAFQKTITMQELTKDGLNSLAPTIEALANLEGLDAHARAVTLRTKEL